MMTTLILLLNQETSRDLLERAEAAERGRFPFTAGVTVETPGKGDSPAILSTGRLFVARDGSGERMLFLEMSGPRPARTLIRGAEAITRVGRARAAAALDLSKPAGFHPLDLVRSGLSPRILDRFEATLVEDPAETFPDTVTGPEGKAIEPRPLKPDRRRRAYTYGDGAEAAHHALVLVPRDGDLQKRLRRIRLLLDRETLAIERLSVEGTGETFVLGKPEDLSPVDPSLFEIDLSDAEIRRE